MSLQDGLYKVHFQTPLGSGDGVVTLSNGKLRGGDSMIFYNGTYSQNGDQFSAQVATGAHSHPPGIQSVFGRDSVNITITGKSSGTSAQLTGKAKEVPNVSFQATLTLLAA